MGNFAYKPQFGVIIICSDEEEQKTLFEEFKQKGYKLKIVCV